MGRRTMLVCDVCGGEKDVSTLVVSYPPVRTREMELCLSCYRKNFAADRYPHSQSKGYSAGRPMVRLSRTVLPPQPGQPVTQPEG